MTRRFVARYVTCCVCVCAECVSACRCNAAPMSSPKTFVAGILQSEICVLQSVNLAGANLLRGS